MKQDRSDEYKAKGPENPTPVGSKMPKNTTGSTIAHETLQFSSVQSSSVQLFNEIKEQDTPGSSSEKQTTLRSARERQRAPKNTNEQPISLILPHQTHLGTENALN